MSVEFRQRKPGEYARMLWRRKWLIVLPTLAVALAVGYVVWKLPNVYESTTLLTVRPASINTSAVPRLSDSDLTIRINNIGQEVTSRSSLEPLIERYGLYARERNRGEPMDVLVERMRTRDIRVEVNTSRDDITNGFYLSFRSSDPRAAQGVTAELASKYINAQTGAAQDEATQTKQFFEEKLKQAKDELDAVDRQRLEVMMNNRGSLPQSMDALVGQLASLREDQKSIMSAISLLRERRSSLNTQQADLEKQRTQEIENVMEEVGDPKKTMAYAELATREAQLESELQRLLAEFRDKHPDVIAKRAELKSVQGKIKDLFTDWKARVEEKRQRLGSQIDPRLNSIKYELQSVNAHIAALEKRQATSETELADINQRLNSVPDTSVKLEAINRDYQARKSIHDELLKQRQDADLISSVAERAQGETIAVIDSANLPEQPVAPNRPMLIALGLVAGLGCGLFLAALFEVPRLMTIQTTEDVQHYTGLPVLVTLPNMLTAREQRRLKVRRAALAFAGVTVSVFSVPAMIIVLRVTHVVELFASRG